MKSTEHGSTRAIWSICAALILCASGARATELLPDPNNAALLYYQALAIWSDVRSSYADTQVVQEPNDRSDTEPNTAKPELDKYNFQVSREQKEADRESSRQRMRRQTIDLVEAASRMPWYKWGRNHSSEGWSPPALDKLRHITLLLKDDAEALVAAGDYRAAIERYLTIRRFARHLGDETITLHNVSLMVDGVAFRGIRNILNNMPPDGELLTWLKDESAMSRGTPVSFVRAMDISLQHAVKMLERHPTTVARIRNRIVGEAAAMRGKEVEEEVRSITDEVLISEIQKQASSVFADFIDSVSQAVEKNKPYDQTYMEIELLTHKLLVHDIIVPFYDLTHVMITSRFYEIDVSHQTMMNATKAAVEIYLVRAKTGKLPDVLPAGLPKNPYTCRDFGYEIIDGGFAIQCEGKQFQRERARLTLEFMVRE